MALMSQAAENDGDQQLLNNKSKGTCCGCCKSCCAGCIRCTSGFLLLLAIAAIVLCVRFFLEFPVILNGYKNTRNFTLESVDAIMEESPQSPSNQTASSEKCKMFVGSFQLLNETYVPQYSDTSTSEFQRVASHVQKLLNKIFRNSALTSSFRNASLFSLRSDPIIAYFQLLFCNPGSAIKADAVIGILQSYSSSQKNESISVNVSSVTVGEVAPCPMFGNAAQPWPWQVLIKVQGTSICVGSLLTASWVLSSANCLLNRDLSLLTVTLASGSSTQTVDQIIQHPNFSAAPAYNNFALIHLSMPVWFTSSLLPLCLPQVIINPDIGGACNGSAGDLVSGGSAYTASTVASEKTCLSYEQNGTIYIKPTVTIQQISQMDTGNALVCINTADNTAYIQGISPYLANGSLISSTCLSYTTVGPAVNWITSYILSN